MALIGGLLFIGCDRDPGPDASATSPPAVERGRIDQSLAAAEQYLDAMDLAKARAILLTLVEKDPSEARGHELLGRLRLMEGTQARARGDEPAAAAHFASSYDAYRLATAHAPDSAGLHQSAGEVAQVAGDPDTAIAHYRRAAVLDPANPKPLIFAAQILIERGQLDEAERAVYDALALDPEEPLAIASLALIAMQRGDHERALEQVSRARRLAPQELGLRLLEARLWRESGTPRRSVELLAGLDSIERARAPVAAELAAAYAALNDPRAAARAWEFVYAAHPDGPQAWRAAVAIGEHLLTAGEREDAAAWLERARAASPTAPEVDALAARFRAAP